METRLTSAEAMALARWHDCWQEDYDRMAESAPPADKWRFEDKAKEHGERADQLRIWSAQCLK